MNRERVHIGSQQHGAARLSRAQHAHHNGPADARLHLNAKRTQSLSHESRRFVLLERQLTDARADVDGFFQLFAQNRKRLGEACGHVDDGTLGGNGWNGVAAHSEANDRDVDQRILDEFSFASEVGNERIAITRVAEAVRELELPLARLERLKNAVAEATMNAIEHGNKKRHEMQVTVRVGASNAAVNVWITDQGGGRPYTDHPVENGPRGQARWQ